MPPPCWKIAAKDVLRCGWRTAWNATITRLLKRIGWARYRVEPCQVADHRADEEIEMVETTPVVERPLVDGQSATP
jgi:hypothetical protein